MSRGQATAYEQTWVFAAPLRGGRWVVTCTSCGQRNLCISEHGATQLVRNHRCPEVAG